MVSTSNYFCQTCAFNSTTTGPHFPSFLPLQTITMVKTFICKDLIIKHQFLEGNSHVKQWTGRKSAASNSTFRESVILSGGFMSSKAFTLWPLNVKPRQLQSTWDKFLKSDLLICEVAWSCRQMKAPLRLTVVSSKQRIEVVSPILP